MQKAGHKSVVIGLICGVLVTAAVWHFLAKSKVIAPFPASGGAADSISQTSPAESPDAALVQAFNGFEPAFPGSDDLIAHRESLQPFLSLENWDKAVRSKKLPEVAKTEACNFTAASPALFLPERLAQPVIDGKSNVLFLNRNRPPCFISSGKIVLGINDLIRGRRLFQLPGEIVIQRILEPLNSGNHKEFFDELKMDAADAEFLANAELAPLRRSSDLIALQVVFVPGPVTLDPFKIPPFVPGAESLTPEAVASFAEKNNSPMMKPVLIDARDRRFLSAGAAYPGATLAAITATEPDQLRFRSDLTLASIAGAKFDISSLPTDRETPLIIFGNDELDASPLWVIRNLRLQNYRNLFYVSGGLKAMQALKKPIAF